MMTTKELEYLLKQYNKLLKDPTYNIVAKLRFKKLINKYELELNSLNKQLGGNKMTNTQTIEKRLNITTEINGWGNITT